MKDKKELTNRFFQEKSNGVSTWKDLSCTDIDELVGWIESKKKEWKDHLFLELVAEFGDYDHPLEFDAKYVQNYLLEKLNDKKNQDS